MSSSDSQMQAAVRKIIDAQIDRKTLKMRQDDAGCCGTRYNCEGVNTSDFYDYINLEHQIKAYRRCFQHYASELNGISDLSGIVGAQNYKQLQKGERLEYACKYLCVKLAAVYAQLEKTPYWEDEHVKDREADEKAKKKKQ